MSGIIELIQNISFSNLDLLSVGITIAAIGLLGFIVYISNAKSITNVSFIIFCSVTILWSFFNYSSSQTRDPDIFLQAWKITIFLGFWHSFSFFNFLYVFPKEKVTFPTWYKFILIPYITIFSLWALFGDLVFSGVQLVNEVPEPIVGKGIVVLLLTAISLIVTSFIFLIRRIIKAKKGEKTPFVLILVGAIITFLLLFTFNLILPAVFEDLRFIPLGAVTFLPFSVFTAYAIFKHKAFKVQNLGASLMAFALCIATFVEVIFAENTGQLLLRVGIFLFVLLISIQFIKNISTLEHLTENLEEANEKLQSLDKLKSEFISLASHQLRSPLTVIKGYASTLTDGVVGDLTPKQNEIVRHIFTSAQGLASVVEDFLNVTKIEQGGMKYVFEETDIKIVVKDLMSDMKIAAQDKGLSFETTLDEADSFVLNVDGVKLKQVFLNLIDNSIKYTKEGFVKVSLHRDAVSKQIIFSVQDSGIGITKETKAKLFTKFSRGEGGVLNSGGSGLGLYLAHEIVQAHHGLITISSDGVGKGSLFTVTLPTVR
jgi:signal transduction histidine kinase